MFVDLGQKEPINLALGDFEVAVDVDDSGESVSDVRINVRAEGKDFNTTAVCRFDDQASTESKPVELGAGQNGSVTFRALALSPGLHRAEIRFASSDGAAFDNVRYVTFRVPKRVPVLALADRLKDADSPGDADLWEDALESWGSYNVTVKKPAEVKEWAKEDWNEYPVVCLVSVAEPEQRLWEALGEYVKRGGSLVVLPGGDEMRKAAYVVPPAMELMPGKYAELLDADDQAKGTTWLWNSLNYRHEILAPFREWEQQPDIDFVRFRPAAYHYWKAEPSDKNAVIVSYADEDKNPALLERRVGIGRVLMFTATMDGRRDPNQRPWNTYNNTSFYFVLANLSMDYLSADLQVRRDNYTTGQVVRVPLPLDVANSAEGTYLLDGPGVSGSDALIRRPEAKDGKPADAVVLQPRLTGNAGNFTVRTRDRSWVDGFSLNPPPSESVLAKADVDAVEQLLGEDSVLVFEAEEKLDLGESLQKRFNQPVDLFPWLMLLLLLLFVFEGLLANRFYRRRGGMPTEGSPESGHGHVIT